MLTLPPTVQIFVSSEPADMRRSFDGLSALVLAVGHDPLSGHLFVFRNRRGDRVKILCWDRSGFTLWYKRLEKGTFHLPRGQDGYVELEAAELMLLLEGIDLSNSRRQKRFRLARR